MWTPSISSADEVEVLRRRGLPRGQLRGRLRHKATTHRALARAPAPHRRRHRLQAPRVAPRGDAHEHLLDHAPIQRIDIGHGLERGQGDLMAVGPDTRPPHRDLATTQDDFAAHGARPRGVALSHMRIPGPAQGDAILFEHRFQHLQAGADRQLEQLGPRVDE